MIEVLKTGEWIPEQFKDNFGQAAITPLQITKLRVDGRLDFAFSNNRAYSISTVYVREAVHLANGGFTTSSPERWGMKKRGCLPSTSRQVLEITMPAYIIKDQPLFEDIKRQVEEADGLKRKVVTNKQFTAGWAEEQLKSKVA